MYSAPLATFTTCTPGPWSFTKNAPVTPGDNAGRTRTTGAPGMYSPAGSSIGMPVRNSGIGVTFVISVGGPRLSSSDMPIISSTQSMAHPPSE